MRVNPHEIPRHLDAPILWYCLKPMDAKIFLSSVLVGVVIFHGVLGFGVGLVLGWLGVRKYKRIRSRFGAFILGRWVYFNLGHLPFQCSSLPKSHIREIVS